jgi:hypothetical protein
MQRFPLIIFTSYMVFSLLNKIMSIVWFPTTEPSFTWHALYVLKRYILRKDLKKNSPIFKQCLNWCRMSNEKINYKIIRVDLDLKNVAILCESDRKNLVTSTRKPSGIGRRYDHLTSLLKLKVITVILPCIILFITLRLFSLHYGGTQFIWKATTLFFKFSIFIVMGN